MRRFMAFFVSFALFFLSSCTGQGPLALFEDIRAFYSGAQALSISADVTADYGGTIFEFTLLYSGSIAGGRIEVLAPETVAGIQADVSFEDGVTLRYDGAELYTGALSPDGLSPVDCIPVMLRQWCSGYISAAGYDSVMGIDALQVDFDIDGVLLRTWFDRETWIPVTAEFVNGNAVVITCVFRDVADTAS